MSAVLPVNAQLEALNDEKTPVLGLHQPLLVHRAAEFLSAPIIAPFAEVPLAPLAYNQDNRTEWLLEDQVINFVRAQPMLSYGLAFRALTDLFERTKLFPRVCIRVRLLLLCLPLAVDSPADKLSLEQFQKATEPAADLEDDFANRSPDASFTKDVKTYRLLLLILRQYTFVCNAGGFKGTFFDDDDYKRAKNVVPSSLLPRLLLSTAWRLLCVRAHAAVDFVLRLAAEAFTASELFPSHEHQQVARLVYVSALLHRASVRKAIAATYLTSAQSLVDGLHDDCCSDIKAILSTRIVILRLKTHASHETTTALRSFLDTMTARLASDSTSMVTHLCLGELKMALALHGLERDDSVKPTEEEKEMMDMGIRNIDEPGRVRLFGERFLHVDVKARLGQEAIQHFESARTFATDFAATSLCNLSQACAMFSYSRAIESPAGIDFLGIALSLLAGVDWRAIRNNGSIHLSVERWQELAAISASILIETHKSPMFWGIYCALPRAIRVLVDKVDLFVDK